MFNHINPTSQLTYSFFLNSQTKGHVNEMWCSRVVVLLTLTLTLTITITLTNPIPNHNHNPVTYSHFIHSYDRLRQIILILAQTNNCMHQYNS